MKLIRISAIAVIAVTAAIAVPATTAQAATRSCSSSTPIASRPTLRYGDTGSCVRVAQQLLLNKGYSLGGYSATGNFLSYTKAAVLRFQKNSRLVQNGAVDQPTWKKLAASTSSAPQTAPKAGSYNIYRGPNYTSRVVLTFDDCPNSLSSFKATVRYAKQAGIGLVLAPTGDCIKSGRFSASYARSYGAYVINHSVTHPDLTRISYTRMLKELSAPGVVTNYGRAPFGAYNSTVKKAYAAKSMKLWLWGVDTRDWTGKSQTQVVSAVVNSSYKGSTDLMHMQWRGFNPSALSQMKSGLAKRGLSVCRPYPGTTPVKLPASLPC